MRRQRLGGQASRTACDGLAGLRRGRRNSGDPASSFVRILDRSHRWDCRRIDAQHKQTAARFPVKQAQSVEIAYLMSGGVVSQRRLSRRGEWRAGMAAFGLVAGMSLAGALLVGVGVCWARTGSCTRCRTWWSGCIAGVGAAVVAAIGPRAGPAATGSAPASTTMPLRRTRCRWSPDARRLRHAAGPGMTGQLESGRAPIPLESVIGEGWSTFRCPPMRAPRSHIGLATFVVCSGPDRGPVPELPGRRPAAVRAQGAAAARGGRARQRVVLRACGSARRSATPT